MLHALDLARDHRHLVGNPLFDRQTLGSGALTSDLVGTRNSYKTSIAEDSPLLATDTILRPIFGDENLLKTVIILDTPVVGGRLEAVQVAD